MRDGKLSGHTPPAPQRTATHEFLGRVAVNSVMTAIAALSIGAAWWAISWAFSQF